MRRVLILIVAGVLATLADTKPSSVIFYERNARQKSSGMVQMHDATQTTSAHAVPSMERNVSVQNLMQQGKGLIPKPSLSRSSSRWLLCTVFFIILGLAGSSVSMPVGDPRASRADANIDAIAWQPALGFQWLRSLTSSASSQSESGSASTLGLQRKVLLQQSADLQERDTSSNVPGSHPTKPTKTTTRSGASKLSNVFTDLVEDGVVDPVPHHTNDGIGHKIEQERESQDLRLVGMQQNEEVRRAGLSLLGLQRSAVLSKTMVEDESSDDDVVPTRGTAIAPKKEGVSLLGLQRSAVLSKTIVEDESSDDDVVPTPGTVSAPNKDGASLLGLQRSIVLSKTIVEDESSDDDVVPTRGAASALNKEGGSATVPVGQSGQHTDASVLALQRKYVLEKKIVVVEDNEGAEINHESNV